MYEDIHWALRFALRLKKTPKKLLGAVLRSCSCTVMSHSLPAKAHQSRWASIINWAWNGCKNLCTAKIQPVISDSVNRKPTAIGIYSKFKMKGEHSGLHLTRGADTYSKLCFIGVDQILSEEGKCSNDTNCKTLKIHPSSPHSSHSHLMAE